MATQAVFPATFDSAVQLQRLATFPQFHVLAWDGDVLYASCSYKVFKMRATSGEFEWAHVGGYRPEWWRGVTSMSRLTSRLVRDGFHALAVHPGGNLIAAVPGAIVTLR